MKITSENDFKNALFYKKLWPKLVADQFCHFLCILSHFWSKKRFPGEALHMRRFPEPQHFFAAECQNWDLRTPSKGPREASLKQFHI